MSAHTPCMRSVISVAIVDDDGSVRVGLQRLCTAFGLKASVYASGQQFLAAVVDGAARADCLLLDAHMPEMSGAELQGQLVARGVEIPTIFFTADDSPLRHGSPSDRARVTYLRKPISGENLLAAIEAAVRGPEPGP